MALGFEAAGFDVLAAVDIDPVHLAAHERNFPLCDPVCADVSALDGAELLAAARRGWQRRHSGSDFAGPVDCVFGGPSCQGFSVIGRRDPDDSRNALVNEFARVVEVLRPRWFVLENVPGLITPGYSSVLESLYRSLGACEYQIAEPWLLNATGFGVPQERKRVFIVGARKGESLPVKPAHVGIAPTVEDAIGDLTFLGRFHRHLYDYDSLHLTKKQKNEVEAKQSDYVRRLNGPSEDSRDLSDPREWDPAQLRSVGLTRHSPAVKERFECLAHGERDSVGRLPRLDPSGQCSTLRAGTGRDHGSFTSARPIHYSSPRVLTVREAARLQSMPDWFGFHETKWHGFRQVGNSVPPLLAREVGATIIRAASAVPIQRTELQNLGSDDLLKMSLSEAADHFGMDRSLLPFDVRRKDGVGEAEAA
jgi:DNA (cytosine-5)-methyltransferase 1